MRKGNHLLVTTVKDEGPHILEWVAWHRLCGFDRIMVFENHSTDLTKRSLRVMHRHGFIRYVENEHGRNVPQIRAYTKASASDWFSDAEWCLAIDGDEFFVCREGDGSIGALTDRISGADAMLINWRNFGSSGHNEMSDDLVTERFTHTVPRAHVREALTGFKSLFRTDAYSRIGIHNARYPKKDGIFTVNGSGLPDAAFERLNWRCKDPGEMALAQINHYPIKDVSSFVLKTLRGRGHQDDFGAWAKYWRRFEHNLVEDRTLADRSTEIRAEMERMDTVSGGRLMLIRRKSQRIWRQKLNEALQEPQIQALYERVMALVSAPET